MAALGWLLNLNFAGGGPVSIPSPEDIKALSGVFMQSRRDFNKVFKKIKHKRKSWELNVPIVTADSTTLYRPDKKLQPFVSEKQLQRMIGNSTKHKHTNFKDISLLTPLIRAKKKKIPTFTNYLERLVKFKEKPGVSFAINERHKVVNLYMN